MSIKALLSADHQQCDERFAQAEAAVASHDWATAASGLRALTRGLEAHFLAEEEILFPAFEQASGMSTGPTAVMRLEHGQIRELLEALDQALAAKEDEAFAGAVETLLILLQQHNQKEENILYPMCDRLLDPDSLAGALRQRLEADGND
ncbi:MAG: hypothetical protein CVU17_01805 [Betaproteobacteria bacterium HGW-Betaproteobacteria-11]|nr:MAG: hypothetical protein CVU17_01805 [Betaproteobacteria bacterium HGW-Betaproteobacteria-11]